MSPCWLFIASSTGLRKTLGTGIKGNPLNSFWSQTLSWVFVWSEIDRNQWSQIIKANFQYINNFLSSSYGKFSLRLEKYNFELQYSPSKDILVSGTLSRSHFNHFEPEFTENTLIYHVHFALSTLPISDTR